MQQSARSIRVESDPNSGWDAWSRIELIEYSDTPNRHTGATGTSAIAASFFSVAATAVALFTTPGSSIGSAIGMFFAASLAIASCACVFAASAPSRDNESHRRSATTAIERSSLPSDSAREAVDRAVVAGQLLSKEAPAWSYGAFDDQTNVSDVIMEEVYAAALAASHPAGVTDALAIASNIETVLEASRGTSAIPARELAPSAMGTARFRHLANVAYGRR